MAVLSYLETLELYGVDSYSQLRKKLQEHGEIPQWFTTGGTQLFFEKYSWNGETVKSRYKMIAKTLAKHAPDKYPSWWNVDTYTAGKTWEEVFFDVLWDGYVSCSTPLLANSGLPERGSTVSCLTADALIHTKHDGLKRMEDIEIGDEVLTHKGRWKKVIDKMSRMSSGDLYQITVDSRKTKTKITGNHPVLTQEGWVNVEDLNDQHLVAVNNVLTEVVEEDYTMTFDNSVLVKESVGKTISDVQVDEDLAWALGLWFAEGNLNRVEDSSGFTHGRSVRVTMASHEECHVKRFLEIMKDKLGVEGNFYHSEFEGRSWVCGTIASKVVAEYFGNNFGISCKTKTVPRWVIDLPKAKLQQFLNGFYCGDGRKPNGDKYSTPDIRIHNQKLIAQLYEISAKLGYTTSLTLDEDFRGTPRGSLVFYGCSDFGFPEKVRVRKTTSDGINLFKKFELVKLEDDELVYDITVEDDHSFTVAGVVVHNCAGGYVGDDLFSRYDCVTEAGILTKHSHGTSYSVDDWAFKGKKLPRGGYGGGVMPVIRDLINCMDEVVQGSRRGSLSYAVSIEHPEFEEVLKYLFKRPESNNPAWLCKDEYIEKLIKDDPEAVALLAKAIAIKMQRGKGYFTKIDEMNRHLAQAFKDAGMTAKASNLCVAPETLILTKDGYKEISLLKDQEVTVWNGFEWSDVKVRKTGVNQRIYKVTVRTKVGGGAWEDKVVSCTDYHKWYDVKGNLIRTKDLEQGLELIDWVTPEGLPVMSYIKGVNDDLRIDDTYCASEPKRNMLTFNGVLTGNCQEVNLASDEDHTFSCVILNLNLDLYDEWKSRCPHLAFIAHVMQDCNVSDYIEFMENRTKQGKEDALAFRKILAFTKRFRAVGTGVLGFHTLLQKRRIVVGSLESFWLNEEIFKGMRDQTLAASKWLAREVGMPEGCAHLGIRNATTMMMPPTKSTAEIMAGASEGIGLDVAMVFVKQSAGGDIWRVNKVLLEIMKERGVYNEDVINDINKHKGSVQHVHWLTQHEKDVFRTAFEIDMIKHLDLCAQRQQYIDQQQSINLYFTSNDTPEYIMKVHKYALENAGILALYYIYSMRGSGDIKRHEECDNCQ